MERPNCHFLNKHLWSCMRDWKPLIYGLNLPAAKRRRRKIKTGSGACTEQQPEAVISQSGRVSARGTDSELRCSPERIQPPLDCRSHNLRQTEFNQPWPIAALTHVWFLSVPLRRSDWWLPTAVWHKLTFVLTKSTFDLCWCCGILMGTFSFSFFQ